MGMFSSGPFVSEVNTRDLWIGSSANDPKTHEVFVLLRFMCLLLNVNTCVCDSLLIFVYEVIHIDNKFV